jgi:hypothetical protein
VGRFDGAVLDAEVMQVGQCGRDGGAQSGDHLQRLRPQAAEIAARHASQHQPVRGVAAFYADELHDPGMGQHPQHGCFALEPPALVRGAGPFGDKPSLSIMCNVHQT